MGYEDSHVDRQVRKFNYFNIHKSHSSTSGNSNSNKTKKENSSDNQVTGQLMDSLKKSRVKKVANDKSSKKKRKTHAKIKNKNGAKKYSKQKNKNKCRKKFKFSKYHSISKKALYDYQFEECMQGLISDALNQINHISNLIKTSEKNMLNCKVEEINYFIKYHKIVDERVKNKQKEMNKSFQNKFNPR